MCTVNHKKRGVVEIKNNTFQMVDWTEWFKQHTDGHYILLDKEKIKKRSKDIENDSETKLLANEMISNENFYYIVIMENISSKEYELVCGNSILLAYDYLNTQYNGAFKNIPAKLLSKHDSEEDKEIICDEAKMQEKSILTANDKYQIYLKLKSAYETKARVSKLDKRVIECVADSMGFTIRTAQKMQAIERKLSDELRQLFIDGKITLHVAASIAQLSVRSQDIILKRYQMGENIDLDTIRKYKSFDKNNLHNDYVVAERKIPDRSKLEEIRNTRERCYVEHKIKRSSRMEIMDNILREFDDMIKDHSPITEEEYNYMLKQFKHLELKYDKMKDKYFI